MFCPVAHEAKEFFASCKSCKRYYFFLLLFPFPLPAGTSKHSTFYILVPSWSTGYKFIDKCSNITSHPARPSVLIQNRKSRGNGSSANIVHRFAVSEGFVVLELGVKTPSGYDGAQWGELIGVSVPAAWFQA